MDSFFEFTFFEERMGCQWVVDGGSFFEFAFFEERMGRWLKVEYSIFEFVFFEERMGGQLKVERWKVEDWWLPRRGSFTSLTL